MVCINATWLRGHVIHAMLILVLNEFPYEPIQLARVCATTLALGTHDVETASHEFSKFGLLIHFNIHIITCMHLTKWQPVFTATYVT